MIGHLVYFSASETQIVGLTVEQGTCPSGQVKSVSCYSERLMQNEVSSLKTDLEIAGIGDWFASAPELVVYRNPWVPCQVRVNAYSSGQPSACGTTQIRSIGLSCHSSAKKCTESAAFPIVDRSTSS